jgi:SAM-dependent methyltransferase
MSFGEAYARAYDTLYSSKNYPAEAQFVEQRLISLLGPGPFDILDVGCGTGLHDIEFATNGHSVVGADMSAEMLARAEERRQALPTELQEKLRFVKSDARDLRTGEKYSAVISLFHVMSYMAGDGDFVSALNSARAHLNPGGAFLFDFWYGPAVIVDPPQRRERVVEESGKRIHRITTPDWDKTRNTVRITFEVTETDLGTMTSRSNCEEHTMRYFFESDLTRNLGACGFEIIETREWLTGRPANSTSFGVYVLARAL